MGNFMKLCEDRNERIFYLRRISVLMRKTDMKLEKIMWWVNHFLRMGFSLGTTMSLLNMIAEKYHND